MKAAVFEEVGRPLAVSTVADPKPEAGELVLAVTSAGICGSDLHVTEIGLPHGTVMGHEFAGEVVEVGAGVSGFRPGDRVTALPAIACGRCKDCVNGYVTRCAQMRRVGFGEIGGAFAEYVRVGMHETLLLPPALDGADAALVEPLAVGLHAAIDAGIPPGGDVYIAGGGPVGLAIALWARVLGAREIIVGDPVAHRRALAETIDAATLDPSAGALRDLLEARLGGAPDLIFECVGRPGVLAELFELAAPGSKVIGAGVCMQPDTFVPVVPNSKELTLQWVSDYRRQDYERVLAMLDAGRVDPLPLVTDRICLADLPAAFEALRRPTTQCKVLVEPAA